MLLILIPVAWLALVAFFVILCQTAARGDAATMASTATSHASARAPRRGLRLWDDGATELRSSGAVHLATRPRVRPATSGGVRPRRPGCVTRS
jgi:hypothetical protein